LNSPTELIAAPDAVAIDLKVASGDKAIRALHQRLRAATPDVKDAAQFLKDLLERAAIASVCIAEDVALPHARTAAVNRIVLAVARTATPVAFDPSTRRCGWFFSSARRRRRLPSICKRWRRFRGC